jgi:hypothetical protein
MNSMIVGLIQNLLGTGEHVEGLTLNGAATDYSLAQNQVVSGFDLSGLVQG